MIQEKMFYAVIYNPLACHSATGSLAGRVYSTLSMA